MVPILPKILQYFFEICFILVNKQVFIDIDIEQKIKVSLSHRRTP